MARDRYRVDVLLDPSRFLSELPVEVRERLVVAAEADENDPTYFTSTTDAVAYFNFNFLGGDPLPEPLRALGGVREFPVRVKCATLPWKTLMAAMEEREGTVTTE